MATALLIEQSAIASRHGRGRGHGPGHGCDFVGGHDSFVGGRDSYGGKQTVGDKRAQAM